MKISVCISMYNEVPVIRETALRLHSALEADFGRLPDGSPDFEIIFADDGSTDGCADIVRGLSLPGVRVISYTPNRGKGYAVRTAMLSSLGDVSLFTDADLAYGTDIIKVFYSKFTEDPSIGLCIGSRNLSKDGYKEYTLVRRIASKVYLRLLSAVGGLKVTDSQCGCKAYSRSAADYIFKRCEVDRFAFDYETLLWARKASFPIAEIPVKVLVHGQSKVSLIRDTFRMLRDLRKMKKRIRKSDI